MSSYRVRNYNLGYEILLNTSAMFEGFIAGVGGDNQLMSYSDGLFSSSYKVNLSIGEAKEKRAIERLRKDVIPRIIDRTTGGYFMKDIIGGSYKVLGMTLLPPNLDEFIHFYYEPEVVAVSNPAFLKAQVTNAIDEVNSWLYEPRVDPPGGPYYLQVLPTSVRSMITPYDVQVVDIPGFSLPTINTAISLPTAGSGYGSNLTANIAATATPGLGAGLAAPPPSLNLGQVPTVPIPREGGNTIEVKETYKLEVQENSTLQAQAVRVNLSPSDPDKLNPALSSIVVRDPEISIMSRNQRHLGVFFNAITPIEASRCVPYISLQILSLNYNKGLPPRGNNLSFMRFTKNKAGKLVFDDNIGMSSFKNYTGDLVPDAELNAVESSYMDIFTAPQTLANANINRESMTSKTAGGRALEQLGVKKPMSEITPVLEPIAPFLTLNDLTVNITGTSFGLMASKKATLKLTLHDRSRLKDIAPLIASNQFATTQIVIEYGWNHPDANIGSKNPIGQYLGALKDMGVYQVVSASYNFSNSNTVDITVNLACSGYNQTRIVSCGTGTRVPLNIFEDFIERAIQEYSKSLFALGEEEKFPEVRSRLRLVQRDARSNLATIDYETYKQLVLLKQNAIGDFKVVNEQKIIQILSEIIGLKEVGEIITAPELQVKHEMKKRTKFQETMPKVMRELIFEKLYGLDVTPDPMSGSKTRKGKGVAIVAAALENVDINDSDEVNRAGALLGFDRTDTVSLGKVLMSFVGHSMSMCGLYDEVQMIFYPFNHHSAGARAHTTASFPILLPLLEKVIDEEMQKDSKLSVNSFFNLIEKTFIRDKSYYAYGLSHELESINNFKKLSDGSADGTLQQNNVVRAYYGYTLQSAPEGSDTIKDLRKRYVSLISSETKRSVSLACKEIYENDGLDVLSEPKFVRPNLSMYFEAVPVVDASKESILKMGGFSGQNLNFPLKDPKSDASGLLINKTLLRIHVYDEESLARPSEATLMGVISEGSTNKLLGGDSSSGDAEGSSRKIGLNLKSYFKSMPYGKVKQFIKRSYPSITYGSSGGVINDMSIQSNTSAEISRVVMVDSYNNLKKLQTGQSEETQFEDVVTFPNTITVNCMGMPLISRGESIFIDFGTDTSIDNIYTVKAIQHSLSSGKFESSLTLVPSNLGVVKSFKDRVDDILEAKFKGAL